MRLERKQGAFGKLFISFSFYLWLQFPHLQNGIISAYLLMKLNEVIMDV
jgi:hypothetical protein